MAVRLAVVVSAFIVISKATSGYARQDESAESFIQWLQATEQRQNNHGEAFNGKLFVENHWPAKDVKLGEIGGLGVNSGENPVVFHRADRQWTEGTFKGKEFTQKEDGPITEPTVIVMNQEDGAILDKWGQNQFYLPHGLTIDHNDNYWFTDVALHQVFKFGRNRSVPELTLGKAFEPAENNDDLERFCKPTDVAVARNGHFFVSDGYCNSRIVKYNELGEVIGVFGKNDMNIPHSLALVEELDLLCAADRENRRILCYKAGLTTEGDLGRPYRAFSDRNIMGRVFAITYSETDGVLYAVTASDDKFPGSGLTIDLHTKYDGDNDKIAVWYPTKEGFGIPHDVEVSNDGAHVYVGDLGWKKMFKFDKIDD